MQKSAYFLRAFCIFPIGFAIINGIIDFPGANCQIMQNVFKNYADVGILLVITLKKDISMYKITWFTEHSGDKITCSHMTCGNESLASAFYEKFVEDNVNCTLDGDTIIFVEKYDFQSVVNVSKSMIVDP